MNAAGVERYRILIVIQPSFLQADKGESDSARSNNEVEELMADDLKKRGSPDSKTINMNEDWEKQYWKKKFGVSGQALAGAVRAVGKSAAKVEKYLKDKD